MSSQSRATKVLLTRPAESSARFAEMLKARFGATVAPVISPLFAPRYLAAELSDLGFGAVIFTSETGVLASVALGRSLPKTAYCVGDRTAMTARALGFVAVSASGAAQDLLALIEAHREDAPFLYLRGQEARVDLVAALQQRDIVAQQAVVYTQQSQPLTPAAMALLCGSDPVVVPLFSPATARKLVQFLAKNRAISPLRFVCLSTAVAAEVADFPAEICIVSAQPNADSLLDAMECTIYGT
jgi:uroporphyrinogen-III synthase